MKDRVHLKLTAAAGLMTMLLLAGCKSDEQRALDQARAQAASTNTAQQIQYIDQNGDTVTTTVQPPMPGQTQQVTTSLTPPAPGPKPHQTRPVIRALGAPQPLLGAPAAAATTDTANVNGVVGTQQTVGAYQGQTSGQTYTQGGPAAQTTQPAGSVAPIDLTVPAGTELAIRINQHISVKTSHAGDRFSGEVVEPVMRDNVVAIPRGTPVGGRIDASHRRGHFKGRSILELRLTSLTLNGNRYDLETRDNVRTKKGKGKRTGAFIGGLTGAGALIGGIASGGLGAGIGAASGAGAGTLLAGATGNRDIEIPAESVMHFRLAEPLVVQHQ